MVRSGGSARRCCYRLVMPQGLCHLRPLVARRRWRVVASAVVARQRELGLSQHELVERSGVSAATLRKLRSGESSGFRAVTLARVSEALEWPPDALAVVLEGGTPPRGATSRPRTGRREAKLAALAVRLAPHELRAVERLVEELLKGPGHSRTGEAVTAR